MHRRIRPAWPLLFAPLVLVFAPSPGRALEAYRRWYDDGKVFTCAQSGTGVTITLSQQNVEFGNLPADAQYTINYIRNGELQTDGPFLTEQTSGTRIYGAYPADFPSYPAEFQFRLDTLVDGAVVYRSTIGITCGGDGMVPISPLNEDLGAATALTGTWIGGWSCQTLQSGAPAKSASQDATFEITEIGHLLYARLDGSSYFRGQRMADARKPSKLRGTLTECRTEPFGTAPAFDEVIGFRATASPGKGKLAGSGGFHSEEVGGREIGTCKYRFKRVSEVDPDIPFCP